MTAVPLGETPSLCVLCPPLRARVARPGGVTDWECHDRLAASITEVVNRYARLSAVPSGGQAQGRRAPGYASKPPLDLNAAMLRDPRTAPTTVGEPHSPVNLFLSWSEWLRRSRGQNPRRYPIDADGLFVMYIEGGYLANSMDWITRQSWLPTFAEQIRAVVAQLRSATGDPNPRPVGYCRNPECRHPLFPPRQGLDIRCSGCDAVYSPLEQIRLANAAISPCRTCNHADSQHDNDAELDVRRCNSQWCDCTAFVPTTSEESCSSSSPGAPSSSTGKPSP